MVYYEKDGKCDFIFLISVPISSVGFLELYQHNTGTIFAFMRNNVDSGPLFTHCKMCFTTIPENNRGIPHALEHLLFNGSKKFPFNDSIDKISNRLYCPYVNAFTTDDSTSYEFESINEESFCLMLDVWLDHLLNPILSEESFLTEIVHLDSNAEYHGVVYSEVSSYERDYDEIVSILSKFFTLCNSNERNNTRSKTTWGLYDEITEKYANDVIFSCIGRTTEIENLSLYELKDFHSKYYSLDNLIIFISGSRNLDEKSIFNVFRNFLVENNLYVKEINKIDFNSDQSEHINLILKRKFNFESNNDLTISPWNLIIPFPAEEEELVSVSFTWKFGRFSNIKEMVSVSVLLHYLANGNESPLTTEFVVEREICSNIDILSTCEVNKFHQILFEGVEINRSKELINIFKKVVLEYRNQTRKIVLSDIRCKIEGLYYGHLLSLENNTLSTIYKLLVDYLNYGLENGLPGIKKYLNMHKYLEELFEEDISYWQKLLNDSLDPDKMNCIEFIPSNKLSTHISNEFKLKQQERLKNNDEQYFKNIKEKIESAVTANKRRSIPSIILDSFNFTLDFKKLKLNDATIITDVSFSEDKLSKFSQECDLKFKKLSFQEFGTNCLYFYLINQNTEFFNIQLRLNIDNDLSALDKLLTSFLVELIFQTSVEIVNPNNQGVINYYNSLRDKKPFIPELKWLNKEFIKYDKLDKLMNTFCIDYNAEFSDGWILDSNTTPNQIKITWTTPKEYIELSCILVMSSICGMKIEHERVSTVARTIKGTIMELKLSEDNLINCLSNSFCYNINSLFNIVNIPNFESIIDQLIKSPRKYISDLERVHELFIKPLYKPTNIENFFSLYVIGPREFSNINIKKHFTFNLGDFELNSVSEHLDFLPWETLSKALPLKLGIELNMCDMEFSLREFGNSIFVKIPSSPTACFIQSINLNNFSSYEPNGTHFYNPDIPPLLVLSDYLWDPSSLLFNEIRGNGLAYSGCIDICMSTGQISNCVSESTSIGKSLLKTWSVFRDISLTEEELNKEIELNGKVPKYYEKFYYNLNIVEAIRVSVFKQLSRHRKFNSWAKGLNFDMNVGIKPNFDKYIIEKILAVKVEDIKRVSQKYLKLFLPGKTINGNQSNCIIFCGGSKFADDINKYLGEFPEFKLNVISFSDFSREMRKNVNTRR
ncbi:insulinase [Cryptosporidium ryanae]|uniref:insulinase n=1 Tax=Cryptosporidium ryanae TaxID=515981 RepID=UPI00351A4CD7|nr:insulinase [Cryptosporidium ryanae]